jgi:cell division protein FtsI/penicillin-binding protein 2
LNLNSGEILAPCNSSIYDPGILVGRQRQKINTIVPRPIAKPLYDRGLLAEYPWSPFKATGFVALQEGVITIRPYGN